MKLLCAFAIEEGPAALRQVAACVQFAERLGVKFSMYPEEEPKKEFLVWGNTGAKDAHQKAALACMREFEGARARRKDFVVALAKKIKLPNRNVGIMVSKYLADGVLEEAA